MKFKLTSQCGMIDRFFAEIARKAGVDIELRGAEDYEFYVLIDTDEAISKLWDVADEYDVCLVHTSSTEEDGEIMFYDAELAG